MGSSFLSHQRPKAISEEDYEGVLSALRMPADPNAQYCLCGCNRKILMPLVVACAVSLGPYRLCSSFLFGDTLKGTP